jgi:hypothetical protein
MPPESTTIVQLTTKSNVGAGSRDSLPRAISCPPFYVCGSDQWVAGYTEGAVRTGRDAAAQALGVVKRGGRPSAKALAPSRASSEASASV